MRLPAILVVILVLIMSCSLKDNGQQAGSKTAGQTAEWKIVDPGGAGAMFLPTVSPHDPDHAFVRCDMTGAYVTENGGTSWRMFNLRTSVDDFEFDPNEPNTAYASNSGLYRSENRGRTWRLIYPDPEDIVAERMVGDHAEQSFETREGILDWRIDKVRVDPADSRHIYISQRTQGKNQVKLLTSHDRGKSWQSLALIRGSKVLDIFPGSWRGYPDEALVVTDLAVTRISEATGVQGLVPLPVESIRAAEGGSYGGKILFYILADVKVQDGVITGGVYRTDDLGEHWVQVNRGLLGDKPEQTAGQARFITLGVCENRPEVVYLSCNTYMADVHGSPERQFGTLKSQDAGDSWSWVYRANDNSILTDNYSGYWKDWSYGPGWSESPWDIGVSPSNPDVCYLTDTRTFRSMDGGASWQQVCSDIHPDSSCSTRNIGGNTTYGVHFDPFNKQHILITYTDIGLFQSFNSGESWLHAISGIPRTWRNTCYWLEFDPDARGKIFSVWANCHDLPRPKMWRSGRLESHQYQGGVAVSSDGSRSWSKSNSGIPANTVCTHILLDPESPVNSRTLYVCGMGRGVYKSTDDGKTWALSNQGLDPEPYAWRMVRLPSGRLFLLVCRGLRGGEVVDGALYVSDDKAGSWVPVPLPEGVNAPNDLVFDPSDPNRMYLSCWPWPENGEEHCGGLLRTEDGGKTWKRVFDEQAHVYAAAVDPSNPSTVYINTYDSAAFRSDDRGETWYRLRGYNFKWGHRPVPDPHNPGMLYLTAFGGNTYHGPAGGVPDAVEDIEDGSFLLWHSY
jgi:photosystem II stability/assembly factor-like uncharacterized protein